MMNEIRGYNLFWDEEKQVYFLRDGEELVGTLLDDTKFANSVLDAFNARLELSRMRNKLRCLKEDMKDVIKICERNA